jgi:putative ABC transport system permease protein
MAVDSGYARGVVRPKKSEYTPRSHVRSGALFLLVSVMLLASGNLTLPYRDAAQLVTVWERIGSDPRVVALSGPDIEEFRGATHDLFSSFGGLAVPNLWLADTQGATEIRACLIEASVLDDLGVRPVLGRTVRPNDPALNEDPTAPAWISAQLWQSRYGGSMSVIGSTIKIESTLEARDALTARIAGVLPPHANVPLPFMDNQTDVWYLLPRNISSRSHGSSIFFGLGRLRPGVSRERAEAALTAVAQRLGNRYSSERQRRPVVTRLEETAQTSTGRSIK